MSYENLGNGPLDYNPCHYGDSRLVFRGPARSLDGEYIAFLGGTETYGKFIADPFPVLVENALGLRCVNLGQTNAGVDVFLNDPTVIATASKAARSVVQVTGANNLSNRFYSVHPRRNDRFLKASAMMQAVFRDVDFTEFHFTRHMLGSLAEQAPDRFALVIEEVQSAWLARMELLLSKIRSPALLLWFADHAPEDRTDLSHARHDPFAIERWMIDRLRPRVAAVIEVVASPAALTRGVKGMVYNEFEIAAAKGMLGPAAHEEAAQAVVEGLERLSDA
jgi:hypothetical protein